MKEDFLHYVWKLKRFQFSNLKTSKGMPVEIFSTGVHNHNAGPDFLNANIKIDDQLWAGNVEIHVRSSDWYLHGHEKDKAYDNVILHVVWEDNIEIFRNDNSAIPTLELKAVILKQTMQNYRELFSRNTSFIHCEKDITSVNDFVVQNWLERLYFERLENKSKLIFRELQSSKNDWEAVLFGLLMKNFGLNVNGDAFYSIAKAVDYKIIRKIRSQDLQLEALLFGLAGLLDESSEERYKTRLREEYHYIKHKFKLSGSGIIKPKFSRLRPANFPSVRLAQITGLYSTHRHLLSSIVNIVKHEDFYTLFNIKTSPYWTTHYTFGKTTLKKEKKLSKAFIELLIINTVLPLKFCYASHMGKDANDEIFNIINALKPEDNSIIQKYKELGLSASSAMETQALLQLYNNYCNKQQCLKCAVGNKLLKSVSV